ncbi:hypothetical protein J1N35_013824 [Gossypium stocksii]|uniref:Reverse transcriptase n=1 Tax=Gossypium stocksii TaxID=47602 RepID=A0A9D4A721_9ROSI|nr:hypothetical protein J1N35_013824 [Gossypium stocksii]
MENEMAALRIMDGEDEAWPLLSSPMRLVNKDGLLIGEKICCKRPEISHLLFVDDGVFSGGAMVLKHILREYEGCRGQCINFDKSLIFTALISRIRIEIKSRKFWR